MKSDKKIKKPIYLYSHNINILKSKHSLWIAEDGLGFDDEKNIHRFLCEEHIYDETDDIWTYFEIRCSIKEIEKGVFKKIRFSRTQYDYFTASEQWPRWSPGIFYFDDSFSAEDEPNLWDVLIKWLEGHSTAGTEHSYFYRVSCRTKEEIICDEVTL